MSSVIIKFCVQISSLVSCWSPGKHHFPHGWDFICMLESFILPKDRSFYHHLQKLCWPQAVWESGRFQLRSENVIENVYLSKWENGYFKFKFWSNETNCSFLKLIKCLFETWTYVASFVTVMCICAYISAVYMYIFYDQNL